eukprot:6675348-Lingulodinium_polyedra.AAC.1
MPIRTTRELDVAMGVAAVALASGVIALLPSFTICENSAAASYSGIEQRCCCDGGAITYDL